MILAISGGADSVALLHMYASNGTIVHVNHGLRDESDADEEFVKNLAVSYKIPFFSKKVDVKGYSKLNKVGIETAARILRYEFFAEIAKKLNCFDIYLAHHADDQNETVLWNLVRGSIGIVGIKEKSTVNINDVSLTLHRPLLNLNFSRNDLREYNKANNLLWVEDKTNAVPDCVRNKFRLEIIPFIEQTLNRKINLSNNAKIASQESEFLDSLLPAVTEIFETTIIKPLNPVLQRRFIKKWLALHKISQDFDTIERILSVVMGTMLKTNTAKGRFVKRKRRKVFLA